MAVPSSIDELSTTAGLNAPAGGEDVFPQLDNYLRSHAAFIAFLRDQYQSFVDGTGFAVIVGGNDFIGAQAVAFVTLTDGANIATDASDGNHFAVTLGGNRTLDNPTNMSDGVILNWRIKQDGTGSRTLTYGSKFKWANGTAPTLSTTAGAVDRITGQYIAADDVIECVCTKGFA